VKGSAKRQKEGFRNARFLGRYIPVLAAKAQIRGAAKRKKKKRKHQHVGDRIRKERKLTGKTNMDLVAKHSFRAGLQPLAEEENTNGWHAFADLHKAISQVDRAHQVYC